MPARTLNDFFAGFFYGEIKANLEVKMLITLQKGQGKGNVKKIKVEGGSDKEKEVIIRHEIAHRRKGRSTWNWHEEFGLEWSQTFITKKKGRNQK